MMLCHRKGESILICKFRHFVQILKKGLLVGNPTCGCRRIVSRRGHGKVSELEHRFEVLLRAMAVERRLKCGDISRNLDLFAGKHFLESRGVESREARVLDDVISILGRLIVSIRDCGTSAGRDRMKQNLIVLEIRWLKNHARSVRKLPHRHANGCNFLFAYNLSGLWCRSKKRSNRSLVFIRGKVLVFYFVENGHQ